MQDEKWVARNTWCLAIRKNLATNFDRLKFVEGVLTKGGLDSAISDVPTMWKSLKGAHDMGAPPSSLRIGLPPLWKGHLIKRRMEARFALVTCQKVGREPPSSQLLAPEPSHRICHKVHFPCKLSLCWEAESLHLRPDDRQRRRAELRET